MKRATYEDVRNAPELHFGEHVVVPDLAGWRRERLPAVPRAAWLSLAPDRAEPFDAIELDLGELWPEADAA